MKEEGIKPEERTQLTITVTHLTSYSQGLLQVNIRHILILPAYFKLQENYATPATIAIQLKQLAHVWGTMLIKLIFIFSISNTFLPKAKK